MLIPDFPLWYLKLCLWGCPHLILGWQSNFMIGGVCLHVLAHLCTEVQNRELNVCQGSLLAQQFPAGWPWSTQPEWRTLCWHMKSVGTQPLEPDCPSEVVKDPLVATASRVLKWLSRVLALGHVSVGEWLWKGSTACDCRWPLTGNWQRVIGHPLCIRHLCYFLWLL